MHYSMLTKHFCKIIMHTCIRSNPVKQTFLNSLTKCFHIMFMEKTDECSVLCDEELIMMHQINFPLTKKLITLHVMMCTI